MSMRKNILALSLFEAAKALKEQAEATPPSSAGGDVPTDDETGEALTLDHILDRLNTIRSGKSFQDPEVYGKLTSLYKAMPVEDKIRFNQQLRNIGAVVQNQTPVDLAGPSKEASTPLATAPETAPAPAPPPAPATPPPAAA